MALPVFRKRRSAASPDHDGAVDNGPPSPTVSHLKRNTRTRRNAIITSSICYMLAVVFLILVEIGNTNGGSVLGDIYFYKLDLADIIPQSAPNLTLMNSIARTLGLHDFYQVGLWNFCEGYDDMGITYCTKPATLYWFNPVEILRNELFAGASIALPSEVNDVLNILRICSQVMFGFFITGLLLDFVLIFVAFVVLYSRWWSLPIAMFSFFAFLMVTVAAAIGTAMSFVFKYALTSQTDLNIQVDVGTKMLAFMWIAVGFTFIAFIIQAGLGCCCTSRRDLRTGRRQGRHLATVPAAEEKKSTSASSS